MLKEYFLSKKSYPIYLRIKVIPNSPKNEVKEITSDSEHGDTIKIRISAQPEKGKANKEIIKFLASELEIPKPNISIISGAQDRIKLIKIIE